MREGQIAILSDADLCRATFASSRRGVTVSSSIKQMEERVFFFLFSFFSDRIEIFAERARLVSGNYFISSDRNSASSPGAGPARERIFSPLKRRDAARYELAEMFIDPLPLPLPPTTRAWNLRSHPRVFSERDVSIFGRAACRPRRVVLAKRGNRAAIVLL